MKNNPLSDIVTCRVDISNPASGDETFNSILLVVPAQKKSPGSDVKAMPDVAVIADAGELASYGFCEEDTAYLAASVAFAQSPAPKELYVCIRQKDGETTEYEDISKTLDRADGEADFYGIHLTEFNGDADITAAMGWAEKKEKLFCFEMASTESIPEEWAEHYRSFAIFSGKADGYEDDKQPAENKYAALAWMAKCFGYDPGTETWHLKELEKAVPSKLTEEQKKNLGANHVNAFLRYAGRNCTVGGYTLAGEWIDVIRFRDWLKANVQSKVFAVLRMNRKIPFTDRGITLIGGAIEAALKEGQNIGGIAQTEYDADGNELPGYRVYVPKAYDLTEAERKSRKLTGCRYTARLAGAIHLVEVEGFLTF